MVLFLEGESYYHFLKEPLRGHFNIPPASSPSVCRLSVCLPMSVSLHLCLCLSASPLPSLLLIIKSKASSMLGKYSAAGLKLAILLPLLREHRDDRSGSAGRLCHSVPSSSHLSAHYTSAQLCPVSLPFQKAVQEATLATISVCQCRACHSGRTPRHWHVTALGEGGTEVHCAEAAAPLLHL